ncbi:intradiol ring-cleavage dioxygenase [Pelagovum pacificum]|nr:intradiol ring-cleavage dioxygenase [Pelagovum pacificum]QQA44121.1 intradiol ring-cleavage dioxygenase [Pelagovum pacificum]
MNRRHVLKTLAMSPLPLSLSARAWAEEAAGSAGLITAAVCTLTPETTAGPYYYDPGLVRSDITEDREGVRLELSLQVVGADCEPISGARVDVWHCDAQGNYSGYVSQGSDRTLDTSGQSFLRGIQQTDRDGVATFRTIYPGWYRGRTPHIHYIVYLDRQTVLTSQLFFDDTISDTIYGSVDSYSRGEPRNVTNRADGIARRAGNGAYASVARRADGLAAGLVVGVAA